MNELFAPSRRHTEEERQRLEITRDDAGDADPGRGPIDLRSGVVLIRMPGARDAPAESGAPAAPADPGTEAAPGAQPGSGAAPAEPSGRPA
ncbi:DUF6191 domain-containing protein [Streptomyces sp. NPDC014894]|uniref:DUF6191 domain-containing protein n=1 Tax=Streptomyces sp. NPDC014894 TaxID=3364931 RepID=UPI0036F97E0A